MGLMKERESVGRSEDGLGSEEAWHGKGRGVVSGRQEAFGLERMAGGNDKRAKKP